VSQETEHQNPEFGHTQGERLKKTLQKSPLVFKGGMKLRMTPTQGEAKAHALVLV